MKKCSKVHTVDGEELVFTSTSFDYCCGNNEGSLISISGETFDILETASVVSNMLEEMED